MKIIGIIQARTGSKRFPKKVLMPILGKTLLEHMVERVKKSKYLDEIWIATTKLQSDNILESLAKDLKVKGSSLVLKIGTKALIRHVKDAKDHQLDCKVDGAGEMMLTAQFVKKA